MKRQRRSVLARAKPARCHDLHPCQDPANPRANDPLAIGVEELKWTFPPSPDDVLSEHKLKKKQKMITPTLLKTKNPKQSLTPFAFPAPAAREVSVAGDFNNWDTKIMPMHKGADGVWHLSVALKPGRHEYRFLADGAWQDDPAAQQKTANGMGGENCVKTVTS